MALFNRNDAGPEDEILASDVATRALSVTAVETDFVAGVYEKLASVYDYTFGPTLHAGRLQALQRNYIPQTMDEHLVRLWGTVIADVATTYVHNLTRGGKESKRFERSAVNDQMPRTAIAGFAELLEREGQAFLERVDQWLTARESKVRGKRKGDIVRLGVGLYHIED